ncbi:ankyrin repeats (many copies) domain-containing protein [Hirsutella rhossiliensis]|uniref:Ankyrin repeats (Many copies) domain-containing protein n=1 Tax=Hirsutella rhossiliensis TaxID=111463 RepID=A0A9P8MX67_9HYPO|nr:ankyrin repeats (many copies) domain-containing protein [Hirsutella rhossiliensis]KAH0962829.1 ankyrin repeats (many copies) domain-containing protein [Hirsutella rhossiliensis]
MAQRMSLPPLDAAWDPTLQTDDDDEYCWTPLQLHGLLNSPTAVMRYNGGTALQAAAERAGYTALQAAAGNGYISMVQLLLQHGANVNGSPAKYKGFTALQGACLQGDRQVLTSMHWVVFMETGWLYMPPPREAE